MIVKEDMMMKTKIVTLLGFLMTAFLISGCSNSEPVQPEHVHSPGDTKKINEIEPTCLEDGSYDLITYCATCKEEISREHKVIKALGHDMVHHEGQAPTCYVDGYTAYDECTRCGYSTIDYIPALDHEYGDPIYTWSNDYSTCTAKVVCKHDSSHIEEETVDTYRWVEKEPTIVESGSVSYIASFEKEYFEEQTKVLPISPIISGEDELTFVLNNDQQSYSVSGLDSTSKSISIPSEYKGLPVTSISSDGFVICEDLEEIAFTSSIKSIGKTPFYKDYDVRIGFIGSVEDWHSIDGLENVKNCDKRLFNNEEFVVDIIIPGTIKEIKDYSFANFYGDSLVVQEGVTSIGKSAFESVSFKKVLIADTVTYIGDYAFCQSSNLDDLTLSEGLIEIGIGAFSSCYSLTKIVIPDSVVKIGAGAFGALDDVEKLVIGENVAYLGRSAIIVNSFSENVDFQFKSKNLQYVDFAGCDFVNGLERTEYHGAIYARNGDNPYYFLIEAAESSLDEIVIHEDCHIICRYAFAYCHGKVASINIPDNVMYIGDDAFAFPDGYWAEDVKLGNGVLGIGKDAFYHCSVKSSIHIPASLREYGPQAFRTNVGFEVDEKNEYFTSIDGILYNKDKTVLVACTEFKEDYHIPEGVTRIGEYAFNFMYIADNVYLPESLQYIDYGAFEFCNFRNIYLPNGLLEIGDFAFEYNQYLESIHLGKDLRKIGDGALGLCTGLDSISISKQNQYFTVEDDVLFNKDKTTLICSARKTNKSYVIPNTVTRVDNFAFYHCELEQLTISDSVEYIGKWALAGNEFEKIVFPNSITHFGDGFLDSNDRLKYIIYPETVNSYLESHYIEVFSNKIVVTPYILNKESVRFWLTRFYEAKIYFRSTYIDFTLDEVIPKDTRDYDEIISKVRYYFYSEEEPTVEGNYWHYDNYGAPVEW